MSTTELAPMQLAPYLFFYGRCEEALEFYKGALSGAYELRRNDDMPTGNEKPEWGKKVMHATFTAPGVCFLASDGASARPIDSAAGNIALSLTVVSAARADEVFAALAVGGSVRMPLAVVPWGGRLGNLCDRFGTEWIITCP